MAKEGKITLSVAVPYRVSKYLREEAEKEGEDLSPYLRRLLKHVYLIDKGLEKMEASEK